MDVDEWQLRAQAAMHEQGTLLEIARLILAFAADMDDLTRELCREIVERHRYDHFAIYLSRRESRALELAHGDRLGENLSRLRRTRSPRNPSRVPMPSPRGTGTPWRVAVPIEDGSTVLGAIIAGSAGTDSDAGSALALCKALPGSSPSAYRTPTYGYCSPNWRPNKSATASPARSTTNEDNARRRLGCVDIYRHLYVENPFPLDGEG